MVTQPGTTAHWGIDRIIVSGQPLPEAPISVYLMLNKPFGAICSLHDPQGRRVVTDLVSEIPQRVFPVGRLDFDTLGLLLLTNDGDWAYRLTHPSFRVPKTYKVTVAGRISDQAVLQLQKGVKIKDGPVCRAAVTLLQREQDRSVLRLTITQGKSRQVRLMLDNVDFKVIQLLRTGFGNLQLGTLKVGRYRHLEKQEVDSIKKLVGMT